MQTGNTVIDALLLTLERLGGDGSRRLLRQCPELAEVLGSRRRLLLMNGWTDYAFSGDNVAAHQAGLSLQPPSLDFKAADGKWQTAIEDIGMPVGRPQTVVVDLTGRVPDSATEVRVRTTMRIYWDQVLVDTSDGEAP